MSDSGLGHATIVGEQQPSGILAAQPGPVQGGSLLGWPPMRQLPLDLGQPAPRTLDDFLPGSNADVLAWLQAWPEGRQPGACAYLWGPPGCGKTHLLQGLATHMLGSDWQVMLLGQQGLQSWQASHADAPTLVLIDDCQALDAAQQHWAFNLFIEAATAQTEGVAIVAAGRLPPVDLPVRDDLRTRLGWGLVFAVHPLDDAGVAEAWLRECRRRGLKLAEGVLPYVLTHFSRDLGSMMALLERLDRYALVEQRVVTVPLLKQMLAQETP